MTNEELALSIQAGNQQQVSVLWEQVKGICAKIAYRYAARYTERMAQHGITWDDLFQEGYFAMLAAVKAYNPQMGYRFTTYLEFPMRNRFNALTGLRSRRIDALNQSASLSNPIGNDLTLADTLQDPTKPVEQAEDRLMQEQLHNALEQCLGRLPVEQAEAVRGKHYHRRSYKQIAEELHSDIHTVRRREGQGLQALRRGKNRSQLQPFREAMLGVRAYRHIGYYSFLHGGSIQERAIEELF